MAYESIDVLPADAVMIALTASIDIRERHPLAHDEAQLDFAKRTGQTAWHTVGDDPENARRMSGGGPITSSWLILGGVRLRPRPA